MQLSSLIEWYFIFPHKALYMEISLKFASQNI